MGLLIRLKWYKRQLLFIPVLIYSRKHAGTRPYFKGWSRKKEETETSESFWWEHLDILCSLNKTVRVQKGQNKVSVLCRQPFHGNQLKRPCFHLGLRFQRKVRSWLQAKFARLRQPAFPDRSDKGWFPRTRRTSRASAVCRMRRHNKRCSTAKWLSMDFRQTWFPFNKIWRLQEIFKALKVVFRFNNYRESIGRCHSRFDGWQQRLFLDDGW